MAKTITIPVESGFPSVDVWVNGKKYSYPTGQAVSVPNEVAAVLQAEYSALPEPEQEPPFDRFVVNVEVDSNDRMAADKSAAECLGAFNAGRMMVCRVKYQGSNSYLQASVIDLTSCNKVGLASGTIEFSGITCIAGHVLNVSVLLGGNNLVAVNDIS